MTDRRILKWVLPVDDMFHAIKGDFLCADKPPGPRVFHDNEQVNVWTMCPADPREPVTSRLYCAYATGQPIEDENLEWYATVQAEPFVWHVMGKGSLDELYVEEEVAEPRHAAVG